MNREKESGVRSQGYYDETQIVEGTEAIKRFLTQF